MDRKYAFILLIVSSSLFARAGVSSATVVSLEPIGDSLFVPWAISQNGNVVVGHASSSGIPAEAFRWTEADGMIGLGHLAGGSSSVAIGVSADGSVVAGECSISGYPQAFRWTETSGMQDLRDVLRDDGVDLTEWWFDFPTAVSADGLMVLGLGMYRGEYLTWMATVPEPATLLLPGLGGLMLRKRRQA